MPDDPLLCFFDHWLLFLAVAALLGLGELCLLEARDGLDGSGPTPEGGLHALVEVEEVAVLAPVLLDPPLGQVILVLQLFDPLAEMDVLRLELVRVGLEVDVLRLGLHPCHGQIQPRHRRGVPGEAGEGEAGVVLLESLVQDVDYRSLVVQLGLQLPDLSQAPPQLVLQRPDFRLALVLDSLGGDAPSAAAFGGQIGDLAIQGQR